MGRTHSISASGMSSFAQTPAEFQSISVQAVLGAVEGVGAISKQWHRSEGHDARQNEDHKLQAHRRDRHAPKRPGRQRRPGP